MKCLRNILDFYIDSSIHVSLAVCALAGVTVLVFGLPWDVSEFIFLFTATVTAYNFAKYAGKAGFHHRSLTRQLRGIQIFSLICFLGLIFISFYQSPYFLLTAVAMSVLIFLYALPFNLKIKDLRSWGPFKIHIIALVWVGATVVLPMVNYLYLWETKPLLEMGIHFFFVLALILPFEIRDIKYDLPELGTIPQKYGIRKTKIFGWALLLVLGILLGWFHQFSSAFFWIGIGIALLVGLILSFAKVHSSDYYTSFWAESVPMLWFVLLYFFS